MKAFLIIAIASLALLTTSCMENKLENKVTELQAIFPKGELGPGKILPEMRGIHHWLQMTALTTRLLETSTLNQEPEATGIPIRQVRY
jgi:hypothetical protein